MIDFSRAWLWPFLASAALTVACEANPQANVDGGDKQQAGDRDCTATHSCPSPLCEGVVCSEHGSCEIVEGERLCVCESGYHAVGLDCLPNSATGTLHWLAPNTYEDGSDLDPAVVTGYILHQGNHSGVYTTVEDIGMPSCSLQEGELECVHNVEGLTPGNWYFSLSAYDADGNQSDTCDERSKFIP